MEREAMTKLAAMLVGARAMGRQIAALPEDLVPGSHAEGYAVNELVAEGLGWEPAGWKIAGTNPEMQKRLRTGAPIYGRTFRRFTEPSPVRLAHCDLLDPLVECEFFFVLQRDLPARVEAYMTEEVADAVGRVHAGIEVAECRYPREGLPPMPAILADGSASGRYVVGPQIDNWRDRDLVAMPVTLTVNGTVRRVGAGRDVMGHPLASLVWLANQRRVWGDGLAAGEMVSTGTTTGMLLARAGDDMEARFGEDAIVRVAFD